MHLLSIKNFNKVKFSVSTNKLYLNKLNNKNGATT